MMCVLLIVMCWVLGSIVCEAAMEESAELFAPHSVRGAFLSRGPGARAGGMGEAFVAVADDATAAAWNPGGLGRIRAINGVAMYDLAGPGMGLSRISFALPVGPGVAGVGVSVLNYGRYVKRDFYGIAQGEARLVDTAVTGSFAIANPSWFGFRGWTGISLELVTEAVGGSLLGVTLGTVLPLSKRWTAGVAARHLSLPVEGFSLPAAIFMGLSCEVNREVRVNLDLGHGLADRLTSVAVGGETALSESLWLRGGYKWYSADQGLRGLVGFTAGMGLRKGKFYVDYAYQPFGDLTTSHRVSLGYNFGEARERGDSETGYRSAVRLYSNGAYRAARDQLKTILREDPEHWRAWALLGNCRYGQGNPAAALAAYDRAIELNPENAELEAWGAKIRLELGL